MFFGRKSEIDELRRLLEKPRGSLVICRGRRRIGKSTLIREFAKDASKFLSFEGLAPRGDMSNEHQLIAFGEQLAIQTELPRIKPESWPQAFQLLASMIRDDPTVVLLDEISWMGGYDVDFPGYLKIAWDNLSAQYPNVLVVLCGSVSAWINDNILNNTGFVGRHSWDMVLEELPLHRCNLFWGKNTDRVSAEEKLKVLSVTGGIPKYLEEINPSISAEDNLKRLCFRREGILFREFDQIFSDVFVKRSDDYRNIMRALVHGAKSVSEISQALGKKRSGHMTDALDDLVLAGFVARDLSFDPRTGTPKRTQKYRLRDNYSRFYLRYVEPHQHQIEQGLYRSGPPEQLASWDTILGLQFENLVLANLPSLRELLRLGDTHVLSAAPYHQKKTARKEGCQVDLLIRTKHAVYIVEIKLRKKIGMSVIEEVKEKTDRLKLDRRLSVRTALVFVGDLDPAVSREGYFDFIVPFEDLLTTS